MKLTSQAQQEVVERLRATENERLETAQHVQTGTLIEADTPERIEKRKANLLSNLGLNSILGPEVRDALAGGPVAMAPPGVQRAFERYIGGNDAVPGWFLTRSVEVLKTVGRIHVRDTRRRIGWGTGFLVAPNLLLTNQHVLPAVDAARSSRVEFDYEETIAGDLLPSAIFDLEPETLFVCDRADGGLDYTLVAVASTARTDCQRPGENLTVFGHNLLVREEGKVTKGGLINTIHHPEGQPRRASIRENRILALQDPALEGSWLHYETDTEAGSSGAPLFNDEWQVVGLHHAGVEKRDDQGRILAIGGGLWTEEMGERMKWWYANEGLRVSRFVDHLEQAIQAALTPNAVRHGDNVISEDGQALFEAMLEPPQGSTPATDGATQPTERPPIPRPTERNPSRPDG